MEEVDKLIETMAKKIKEDIILERKTDKIAERVTGLAALITASANHRMMRKYNKLQQKESEESNEKEEEAIDCIVRHINSFLKQARNKEKADFGKPCAECIYRNECNFEWISKMQPVLQRSNVKNTLVRKEH